MTEISSESKFHVASAQVGSTAALDAAGAAGLKAVRELRTMMRVHLRPDPDLLAAWRSAARVERSPKKPAGSTPTPPPPSGS